MTPEDVRWVAQKVAASAFHSVSDASVEAMAKRLLALEADLAGFSAELGLPPTMRPAEGEVGRVIGVVKAENVSLSMRLAHVENLACAAAFDAGLAQTAAERVLRGSEAACMNHLAEADRALAMMQTQGERLKAAEEALRAEVVEVSADRTWCRLCRTEAKGSLPADRAERHPHAERCVLKPAGAP